MWYLLWLPTFGVTMSQVFGWNVPLCYINLTTKMVSIVLSLIVKFVSLCRFPNNKTSMEASIKDVRFTEEEVSNQLTPADCGEGGWRQKWTRQQNDFKENLLYISKIFKFPGTCRMQFKYQCCTFYSYYPYVLTLVDK